MAFKAPAPSASAAQGITRRASQGRNGTHDEGYFGDDSNEINNDANVSNSGPNSSFKNNNDGNRDKNSDTIGSNDNNFNGSNNGKNYSAGPTKFGEWPSRWRLTSSENSPGIMMTSNLGSTSSTSRDLRSERNFDSEFKPQNGQVSVADAALRALADDLERGADWVVSDGEDSYESEDSVDEWGRPTLRSRLSSAADEILAESFQEDAARPTSCFKVLATMTQIFTIILIAASCLYLLQQLFPDVNQAIKDWATWANSVGWQAMLAFCFVAAALLLIPGVPGSLLCFSCGAVFEFKKAFLIAGGAHHLGACMAFLSARLLCRTRFERLLLSRPTLRNMSAAARKEQWKVTFLSRFIVMPVQIKNYLFGVLPVTFPCFFIMSFLGDFQSTVFSVYLGSVSQTILDTSTNSRPLKSGAVSNGSELASEADAVADSWLPMLSLILAVAMTTLASIVARRSYMRVLAELKAEDAVTPNHRLSTHSSRRTRTMRSFEASSSPLNEADEADEYEEDMEQHDDSDDYEDDPNADQKRLLP
mmetsp:Transcript_3582/g.7907  ORF Transcript_3582/g.7907 Transcript_3582/m.7907 type:complete len:533 (-) Transcript_3582:280-1878(-)